MQLVPSYMESNYQSTQQSGVRTCRIQCSNIYRTQSICRILSKTKWTKCPCRYQSRQSFNMNFQVAKDPTSTIQAIWLSHKRGPDWSSYVKTTNPQGLFVFLTRTICQIDWGYRWVLLCCQSSLKAVLQLSKRRTIGLLNVDVFPCLTVTSRIYRNHSAERTMVDVIVIISET